MRYFLAVAIAMSIASAKFVAHIDTVDKKLQRKMINGGSWKKGCPVPIKDLRDLKMSYIGFDGKEHMGELIVHKSVAREVVDIFKDLYEQRYPIRKMEPIYRYGGSDFASIEADNTSAFNCRPVTGGKKWSRHSYGKAIDINPIENPYISRSGRISHKKSLVFRDRKRKNEKDARYRAMLLPHDKAVTAFKKRGWRWGGDWHTIKDYQHFDKPRNIDTKPENNTKIPAKVSSKSVGALFRGLDKKRQ